MQYIFIDINLDKTKEMDHREEYPYEASDEASESELLDRSLSVWSGPSRFTGDDFTPIALDLHTASSIGHYECVRNIIEKHEDDLNRKNKGGWTALMYASYIGYDTVVNLLLEAGVEVNTRNNKGLTPLMLASSCGNESIAYFLLQQGAEIEARDNRRWTALFHATFSGHQNMVKFLLDNDADMNAQSFEPERGMTPFMEAASAGHEIIVQYFLQHGVNVNMRTDSRETARSLALRKGHHKIIGFIDNYVLGMFPGRHARDQEGKQYQDYLSSSDEAFPSGVKRPAFRHIRLGKTKGVSIQDGPSAVEVLMDRVNVEAFSKKRNLTVKRPLDNAFIPQGYVAFTGPVADDCGAVGKNFRYRDVTSPINIEDHGLGLSGSKDSVENDDDCNGFSQTGALTIRSSSSSSSELTAAFKICHSVGAEGTNGRTIGLEMVTDSVITVHPDLTHNKSSLCGVESLPTSSQTGPPVFLNCDTDAPATNNTPTAAAGLGVDRDALVTLNPRTLSRQARTEQLRMLHARPQNLAELLEELSLTKYLPIFEEQDVDLQVFLTLTDNDLHEIGIKLFGPRKKMNVAIARWHSNACPSGNDLEQAYADRLETEMQEMAIQLHQANNFAEQMKNQLLQERELRSVTESCLMEDRTRSQHVCHASADNLKRCHAARELLTDVNIYTDEICQRLLCSDLSKGGPEPNSDPQRPRDRKNPTQRSTASNVHALTNQQLVTNIQICREELLRTMSAILTNMETVLKKQQLTTNTPPGFSGTLP